MKIIINDFMVYYSLKPVKIVYCVIPVSIIILQYLVGIDSELLLFAPGVAVQSMFGGTFGAITVFLTGMVWESDLRGEVIKNIVSSGIDRFRYCAHKLIFIIISALIFSFEVSCVGGVIGHLDGPQGMIPPTKDLLITNFCSFLAVFFIIVTYGFLATVIILRLSTFSLALVVSIIISFLECLVNLSFLGNYERIITPFGFFLKAIQMVESHNNSGFINTVSNGCGVMLIYLIFCGIMSFFFCNKREF